MFDPQLHPRIPAGHPDGGRFAFKCEDKFGTLDDDMPKIHLSALQRSVVDGYRGRLFPDQQAVVVAAQDGIDVARNAVAWRAGVASHN
jgi:hypothetical protein